MYQKMFELHAELLKALAYPRRLEIIQLLRDQRLNVGQIQEMLGLPQANLSQHLMILKEAGVVKAQKQGKQVFYELMHKNFISASDLMREILIEKHSGEKIADELALKMKDLVPVVSDPICGMRLSPKTAAFARQKNGRTYYFCGAGCLKKFKMKS